MALDPATFQTRASFLLTSPDGSRAHSTGVRVTDCWLNQYELVYPTNGRKPFQIARNRVLDSVTGEVSYLAIQNGGQVYQMTTPAGKWYVADTNGGWTQCPDPTKPVPPPGSIFKVVNGQFFDPAGKPFRAKGVNVCYRRLWGDNQVDLDRVSLAALRRAYPTGLNFVRFACHGENPLPPPNDPVVAAWINALTADGIIVLVDLHYTGNVVAPNDQRSNDWLASYGSAFKTNPRVWFDTQNEPTGSQAAVSAMMKGQHDAIRATGNPNPVLLSTGAWDANGLSGMNPGDFAGMKNVGFDAHCYGWMTGNWSGCISTLARFSSADGLMPVICGECGDGGGSDARDSNWVQNMQVALGNPGGFAAWMVNWTSSAADCLWAPPFDGSVIQADYGKMVADAIRNG